MTMQFAEGDICLQLRKETAESHERLERNLDLLGPPISRGRFVTLLRGFHGFHRTWEPAMAACLADPGFTGPRQRLPLLEADLAALGAAPGEAACAAAGGLCDSPAAAMGSLYVLEGATLGGQVIARRLAGEAWLPPAGLTYFTPYGGKTSAMWQEFRARIRDIATDANRPEIVAAARATFDLLHDWLVPAVRAAA